jgi:hypothetical protein
LPAQVSPQPSLPTLQSGARLLGLLGLQGPVAQSGERRPRMAEVRGSSPLGSTLFFYGFAGKTRASIDRPEGVPGRFTATVLQPSSGSSQDPEVDRPPVTAGFTPARARRTASKPPSRTSRRPPGSTRTLLRTGDCRSATAGTGARARAVCHPHPDDPPQG